MVSKDEMLKWMDGVRPEYREPEYDAIRALIDAPSKPRESIMRFAQQMEEKLAANDHKGGWENEDIGYLLTRLREELDELVNAVDFGTQKDVVGEAADIANFAMMIADRAADVEVEDMHAKLKPCPWCRNEKVTAKEELPGYWYIECWSCGASGPVYPHKDTAVSAWNRRKGETDAD